MRHRDWGGGEGGPRERQPIAPWEASAESFPVGPDHSSYRTPSRRRAIERGQQEPAETYLPRWALESGVRRADGGGRHAAPDDDDDVEPPGDGWRATGGWRGESDRRELPALGAEWALDTPQEQGYVGSRRAGSVEDEPVSGATPRSRPRRAQPRRPQVTWSGLEGSTSPDGEAERWDAGRSRRAGDSWSRPAVDPWERGRAAEPDPVAPPAADPWDASGVHAWGPSPVGRWDPAERAGGWQRAEHTGEWDRFTDTGQWARYTDTGRWDRYAEAARWDRTVPPAPDREGWAAAEQAEGFWSGTRLAGDDPRWMETPSSAPRSPVVAYPAPRPRTPARRRSLEPVHPGGGGASAFRRRPEATGGGPRNRRIEDDLLDPDPGGPVRSLVYTAACYLVPALLVFVALLFLDGRAPAGCVTDITGGGCESPRAHAFASLLAGAPRFGLALLSSLVVAVVVRRVGTAWRSGTVALAAAVIGGGLSTVLISAVTGQPIG